MASTVIISLFLLVSLIFNLKSLSLSYPHRKNFSFQAPLIHRSSPESPFYNPDAKATDVITSSVRTSLARNRYMNWLISRNQSLYARSPIFWDRGVANDYVMSFYIGTPPMKTFGIPDTGSSLLWLQCKPCRRSCFKQNAPIFDRSLSSTYKQISCDDIYCSFAPHPSCNRNIGNESFCHYAIPYDDGSYSKGEMSTETLILPDNGLTGNNTINDMVFGCSDENKVRYAINPPAVVGLNNKPLSLVSQLLVTRFSYCIVENTTGAHGWIRFGELAVISGESTKLFYNKLGQYAVELIEITVGGYVLEDIPDWVFRNSDEDGQHGFIIDTGTTFTHLHNIAFYKLIDAVKDSMSYQVPLKHESFELCYNDIRSAPEVEFQFKGTYFMFSNDNLWEHLPDQDMHCLAIFGSNGISALGLYQQRNMNVGYDLEKDMVAFTYDVSNCPGK